MTTHADVNALPFLWLMGFFGISIFIAIPAKFVYDNTAALSPIARLGFALLAPPFFIIFFFVIVGLAFGPFHVSFGTVASFAVAAFAVGLAAVLVVIMYRIVFVVAGRPFGTADPPSSRALPSGINPQRLRRPLQVLDWSFMAVILVSICASLAPRANPSTEIVGLAAVIVLIVYLAALATVTSRLGESVITTIGASVLSGGIGFFLMYFLCRRAGRRLMRA